MRLRRSRHRLPGRLARLPRSARSRFSFGGGLGFESPNSWRGTLLNLKLDKTRNVPHVAEGVGFEPTERFRSAVFKTAAFSRSAIPP